MLLRDVLQLNGANVDPPGLIDTEWSGVPGTMLLARSRYPTDLLRTVRLYHSPQIVPDRPKQLQKTLQVTLP